MKEGVASRVAAGRAVGRVLRDGAYSNRVVGPESAEMSGRDARLVRYLTYGTLRHLIRVDRAVASASSRALDKIQPAMLDSIRVGVFELLFSSADHHGIVDSAAEAVREIVGDRAVGFANAVLRRVAREGEPAIGEEDRALRNDVPEWIYDRVAAAHGTDDAEAFFAAANQEAAVGLWTPGGLPPELEGTAVPGIADAFYLDDGSQVVAALDAGAMIVDPASTAVATAVGARPGEFVLDMAAAPGNKTAQLWEAMQGEGRLLAVERNANRAESAERRLAFRGVDAEWMVADGRRLPAEVRGADRVLLDAPCSGLGTLRRRPEIRHRLEPQSPLRMSLIQRDLLNSALGALKPGGRLVYSVCTVFPEETIDIVADLPASAPEGIPGRPWGNGILLAPHITGTDGMFISVISG